MTNIKRIQKYIENIIRCAVIALSTTFTASLEANGGVNTSYSQQQKKCLYDTVYHESRNQGKQGMIAVAWVTLNRVKDSRFPKTPCKVVYSPSQYSWTKNKPPIKEKDSYEVVKDIVDGVLVGKHKDNTFGATYYHATGIKPYWTKDMKCTTKIGGHKFYKPK